MGTLTDLFVPGRVCLLGEHTDWAVLHRDERSHEEMKDGHCLVYGTNSGLYAKAGWKTSPTVVGGSSWDASLLAPPPHSVSPSPLPQSLRLHFRSVIERPPQYAAAWSSPTGEGYGVVYEAQHDGSLVSTLDIPLLMLSPSTPSGCANSTNPCQASVILEHVAAGGTFFSYVAGAALEILSRFRQQVCEVVAARWNLGAGDPTFLIDNYCTDLPVGKGLSSSAAVCVLVVRALTQVLLGVKLSIREEMEYAYLGERRTPSQCGRMDQCVAHGVAPVSMVFPCSGGGGVRCERIEIPPNAVFYFVVADMNRSKDTQKILSDLNLCFRVDNTAATAVRHFLCVTSSTLVRSAMDALRSGSPSDLGNVFRQYQAAFDAALTPVCAELAAPRLHELLGDTHRIQPLVFGGKGVGSQGDGAIQFVCRDADAQVSLVKLLSEEEGCHAFPFELRGI
jgi:galactokinase